MNNQVLPDGVDFEGSLAYHRLVTEMFFHALWLLTAITEKSNYLGQGLSYRKVGETLFSDLFIEKLGKGTHSHNDSLSFELCYNGKPFIVDPGSYSYTGYPHMRNLLRSTLYHNTVVISGRERNEMSDTLLFRLFPCSRSKTILWHWGSKRDIFIGQISYEQVSVIHRRKIIFNKKDRTWSVSDFFSGEGTHELVWNFHLSPEVEIYLSDRIIIFNHSEGDQLRLEIDYNGLLESKVIQGWYSPGYGYLKESLIVRLSCKTEIPEVVKYCFYGD